MTLQVMQEHRERERERDQLYLLAPTDYVSPEDGDRIQSPKHYVLNKDE
jgi:hypothetical protein